MAHYIGNNLEPATPTGNDEDTSLAVLQFFVLARREWTVQAPKSPFRVERVTAERRYCLGYWGVRWFDVVEGVRRGAGSAMKLVVCRKCGKEKYL